LTVAKLPDLPLMLGSGSVFPFAKKGFAFRRRLQYTWHVHIYINTAVTLWYCIRIFVTFVHNGGVSFLSFFYTFILHSIMKNFIATVTSPISKMRRRRRARPAAPIKINLKQQVK
jgi:hypothetical protein